MLCRGRVSWFKEVLVVILCYACYIKLQIYSMDTDYVLQGRDQDRKFCNNLLYTAIGGLLGVFKSDLR